MPVSSYREVIYITMLVNVFGSVKCQKMKETLQAREAESDYEPLAGVEPMSPDRTRLSTG